VWRAPTSTFLSILRPNNIALRLISYIFSIRGSNQHPWVATTAFCFRQSVANWGPRASRTLRSVFVWVKGTCLEWFLVLFRHVFRIAVPSNTLCGSNQHPQNAENLTCLWNFDIFWAGQGPPCLENKACTTFMHTGDVIPIDSVLAVPTTTLAVPTTTLFRNEIRVPGHFSKFSRLR